MPLILPCRLLPSNLLPRLRGRGVGAPAERTLPVGSCSIGTEVDTFCRGGQASGATSHPSATSSKCWAQAPTLVLSARHRRGSSDHKGSTCNPRVVDTRPVRPATGAGAHPAAAQGPCPAAQSFPAANTEVRAASAVAFPNGTTAEAARPVRPSSAQGASPETQPHDSQAFCTLGSRLGVPFNGHRCKEDEVVGSGGGSTFVFLSFATRLLR